MFFCSCAIFCTVQPDVMGLCSLLWARVPLCYVGMAQMELESRVGRQGTRLPQYEQFMEDATARRIADEQGVEGTQSLFVRSGVAFDECAEVFRCWQGLNGVIY